MSQLLTRPVLTIDLIISRCIAISARRVKESEPASSPGGLQEGASLFHQPFTSKCHVLKSGFPGDFQVFQALNKLRLTRGACSKLDACSRMSLLVWGCSCWVACATSGTKGAGIKATEGLWTCAWKNIWLRFPPCASACWGGLSRCVVKW